MTDQSDGPPALKPGSVVWTDANWLRASGRCQTNSQKPEFDVEGEHYFLLTKCLYEAEPCYLAAALLSNPQITSKNRMRLDNDLKSGPGDGWRKVTSHIYQFQTWRIPKDLLLEWVKTIDYAERNYAADQPQVIQDIFFWMAKNTNDWHMAVPKLETRI